MGGKGIGTPALGPEDLYNLWDGVRELHIDLVGEGGTDSSKVGSDLLSVGMSASLLTHIFILLQTTSHHPF